jgi:hypothetical protein
MSEESWKEEFYNVDAGDTCKAQAVEHSLRKWKGLTKESLRRHGLSRVPIEISSYTCALCLHYYDEEPECNACPIVKVTGRECDGDLDYPEEESSPWGDYVDSRDPSRMIALLIEVETKYVA